MAVGDGDTWDEANPTNATLATKIDDYNRDLRKGIRSRMIFEHEWPASQSATSEAGVHKFMTLQNQSTQPTLSGTQKSALYIKTDAGTGYGFYFAEQSGNEKLLADKDGLNLSAGAPLVMTMKGTSDIVSCPTDIPQDDTKPQKDEGDEVLTFAYTPAATGNKMMVEMQCVAATNQSIAYILAGFRDTTADSFAAGIVDARDGRAMPNRILIEDSPATTGQVTYKMRVGATGGLGIVVNAITGSAQALGGVEAMTFIRLVEIKG